MINEKIILEKTIKYLNKLLKKKQLTTTKEVEEVKQISEKLNSWMYGNKEIRSKNANSYLWLMCTRIANALRKSKEEVYLDMLKSYGQSMMIPVLKGQPLHGSFKYKEYEGTSILNGKEADWYKVYFGSRTYTKREMSILIDGVIQECNNLEIPTISDEEVSRLMEGWNGNG